ncbi:MAG: DNA-directed RNA polymerase subunit beta' [Gammaproteobacteria bacterium AqS3]|nr:DNA-directed RNA polymerase subunit beta' [Gammaproteobacteria bacterium AqS3]
MDSTLQSPDAVLKISLASPQKIRSWSHGEVKKSETINYRTFKPERDGLQCARIFGPVKDYECQCGKYKRVKQRGKVCEKCGVEVTVSRVRRERMGHIELVSPVAHIWFLKSLPSRIGMLLNLNLKQIESVLYFDRYIVLSGSGDEGRNSGVHYLDDNDELGEEIRKMDLLTDQQYQDLQDRYPNQEFTAGIGAAAIRQLIEDIDIEKECRTQRELLERMQAGETKSKAGMVNLRKRLRLLEGIRDSGAKPEWMILQVLPVLPPDLRPLVSIDGGRFATSDLNDLYRRVINRNNRLRRLIDQGAPEMIMRNETRMLQEAVDGLLDNGRRTRKSTGSNKRPLKSLADMIKGKHGRFRQNLLGKRVDYSGRSVIVVGPTLKLHECGLPKRMALELFKPFVQGLLERRGYAPSTRAAKRLIEEENSDVWNILEEVIREHPVLLNRAPTLHRLGIQAFEPVLIEGKAIQLHPLVCRAFNADFDGDQMAIHVPLSVEAQLEARVLMMSSNNILSPASGEPIIVPDKDVVLGIYYMTRENLGAVGQGGCYSSVEEVQMAYDNQIVDIHARIRLLVDGGITETTVGRALLYTIVPEGMPYSSINQVMRSPDISQLVNECYRRFGVKQTVMFSDQLMYMGFHYATVSGCSVCIDDFAIPAEKEKLIAEAEAEVLQLENDVRSGNATPGEKKNKVRDLWQSVSANITRSVMRNIGTEVVTTDDGEEIEQLSFNSIFIYSNSGARGSPEQLRQMAGWRGLMAKPDGEIIETPITASFRDGLSEQQYFISTHGARKGLTDTALKTANSGYLTRKLVDASQELVVREQDCGTEANITLKPVIEGGRVVQNLASRVLGRVLAEDLTDPEDASIVVLEKGTLLGEAECEIINQKAFTAARTYSPVTCESPYGVCVKCYGRDLARGRRVNIGEAVGIIAAQSIGEPGTQLTMRTFHYGGAAGGVARSNNVECSSSGVVSLNNMRLIPHRDAWVSLSRTGQLSIMDETGQEIERYRIPYGALVRTQDDERVEAGQELARWELDTRPILTEYSGTIEFVDMVENVSYTSNIDTNTGLIQIRVIPVAARSKEGEKLKPALVVHYRDGERRGEQPFELPDSTIVHTSDGAKVEIGDILASAPTAVSSNIADITGGLPRVQDLFEARTKKEKAVLAPISGTISFGKETKSRRKIIITSEDEKDSENNPLTRELLFKKTSNVWVYEGERVNAGDELSEGVVAAEDILRLKGIEEMCAYIVNEVQQVYRGQGVTINDKHIECIVRQMLRKVRILDSGDSNYIIDDVIDHAVVLEANRRIALKGGAPITYERMLQGITSSALGTESYLSAASFQETTRTLTEASIVGKKDRLRGLKENIIVGRLIPAGTGLAKSELQKSLGDRSDQIDPEAVRGIEERLEMALKNSEVTEDERNRRKEGLMLEEDDEE